MSKLGKVYLVGAGCGDYDLITLRGMNLLKICDTVVYDSLIDSHLLDFTADTAEKICVGKRAGHHSEKQERINEILVEHALNGKTVVRLKGGDPFVFGRGGEEILALKEHNIPYDIVPGITSAVAVPELAGIPVTHRKTSRGFHVITGHTADDLLPENIKKHASTNETLVILMGLGNLSKITETLILNGKDEKTPAAVITHGASAEQKIVRNDLKNIADEVKKHKIKTPAVIVIGETAGFDFSPTINRPLTGVSVSVTGTERLVDKLSEQLYALGANINKLNYLKICEYNNNGRFNNSLLNIEKYSMIVLTSMNGAE
ncbi:MAG: uroporphyrinogen-III C-methyltransferase, partial [Oscillospiraceae bacterium]|nr:uroporphyrinogen-III C-methyltransferase [Oscillospiraceae bacterium]